MTTTPVAPFSAVIGGTACAIVHGTINGQSQIGQRGQLTFDVLDPSADFVFLEGSAVQIVDANGLQVLSRWLTNAKRLRTSQAGMLYHQLTCTDNCYLADKRTAATTYTSQTTQYIFNDLLTNFLAGEGVYAIRNLLSANQSNIESSTAGFVAGAGTLSRDTTRPYAGSASLKWVTTSASAALTSVTGAQTLGAHTNTWAVTPGAQYQWSAYVQTDGTAYARIKIWSYDATGTFIGSHVSSATTSTSWVRLNVGYTAESNAAGVILYLENNSSFGSMWFDDLQWEPNPTGFNGPQPWETGQTSTIGGSEYTIGNFASNYAQVSACYDALAQKAQGYSWWIDDYRRAYFLKSKPTAAPVSQIDDTIFERDTEYVQHGNTLYRNTQYVLGGTVQTSQQTQN